MRFIFPVFRFYDCVRKTENYVELKGVYGSRFGVLAGVSDFGGKESEEAKQGYDKKKSL